MKKVTAFIQLYAAVAILLLAIGVHAQQPAAKPALTFEEVLIPMRDGVREFCDLLLCAAGRYAELLRVQRGSLDVR